MGTNENMNSSFAMKIKSSVDCCVAPDLSGSLQGSGGVGGLLAVKRDGAWYVPLYDANGHQKSAKPKAMPPGDRDFIAVPKGQIEERYPATQRQLYVTAYVSETGAVVAEYEYDAFGATISQSGMMADTFRHRFSTKPWIAALGAYDYGERLYSPELRRWLSRDPIEEEGGLNLYCFVENSPLWNVDFVGMHTFHFLDRGWSYTNVLSGTLTGNVRVLGTTPFFVRKESSCICRRGKYIPDYIFIVGVFSWIHTADDQVWNDDEYGKQIRDPRVKNKRKSFLLFKSWRRRNLVIEHEKRHRKHARKNFDLTVKELNISEQFDRRDLCEKIARDKILAAYRFFIDMENADEARVERGEL